MRVLALIFAALMPASASAILVTINTSGLSGVPGDLVFDLTGGGGPSGNTASILAFTSDGLLGAASPMGTISGSLPGEVDLSVNNSSVFFSEYLTGFTFGTTIGFTLQMTQNSPGPSSSPDELAVFLLAPNGSDSLITTSDPTGANSLFILDIDGTASGSLTVFGVDSPVGVGATVAPQSSATPEPSSYAVILLGALMLVLLRRKEHPIP